MSDPGASTDLPLPSSSNPVSSANHHQDHARRRSIPPITHLHVGTDQDGILIPEDLGDQETVHIIHNLIHPDHHIDTGETVANNPAELDTQIDARLLELPWWKRPSPGWYVLLNLIYYPLLLSISSILSTSGY